MEKWCGTDCLITSETFRTLLHLQRTERNISLIIKDIMFQNIRSKSNWYYHQLCVVYIYIIVKLLFYVIKITIVRNGVKHFEFELSPESHPDTQSWKRRYESYDLMDILGGSKRVIIYISNTSGCPGIFLINSLIPFLFIPITPTTTGNVLVFICHMQ